ncbi:MAG: tetratricopeptide repeat protein [Gemmataceae bacterium]
MSIRILRCLAVAAALLGVPAALVMGAAPASAQQQTVSNKVGVPLKAAQELAKQKKFKEALAKVEEAEKVPNLTPFEVLTIQKFKVYLYAQLKEYNNAAKAMEAIIATGLPTADETKQYRRQIALLYFEGGNTAKGVAAAKDYLQRYGDDPDLLLLLAANAYKGGDYGSSAEAAQKIIRSAEAQGKKPDEDALVLLVNSEFYLKRTDPKHADNYAAALEKLVGYYPKTAYWRDLLLNAESRPGLNSKYKLDLFVLKFTIGTLKQESEYIDMAETALVQNLPAYSQKVLEAGMKAGVVTDGAGGRNKRLLATATKRAGEEKVTPADEAEARNQATGESLGRLGQTYESYGDHAKAIALMKEAIAKGGLASIDTVRLHLGVAQLRGSQVAAGQATMRQVKTKDGSSDLARFWLLYSRQM